MRDPRLLAYHDWEVELATLTSPESRRALADAGVVTIGYRHLTVDAGRITVRPETAAGAS